EGFEAGVHARKELCNRGLGPQRPDGRRRAVPVPEVEEGHSVPVSQAKVPARIEVLVAHGLEALDGQRVVEDAEADTDGAAEAAGGASTQAEQLVGEVLPDVRPAGLSEQHEVRAERRDQEEAGTGEWLRGAGREADQEAAAAEECGGAAELIGLVATQALDRTEAEEQLRRHATPGMSGVSARGEGEGAERITHAQQPNQAVVAEVTEACLRL